MTVSTRSIRPNLSYIFNQFRFMKCLMQAPGSRTDLYRVCTSPSNRACHRRPRYWKIFCGLNVNNANSNNRANKPANADRLAKQMSVAYSA